MARPTQDDFAVFTTRPKISTRDNDESSPTFGQRVVRDFTDAEWADAKASAQYEFKLKVNHYELLQHLLGNKEL